MQNILIASSNPHKQKKLSEIVNGFYIPEVKEHLDVVEEYGENFLEIAEKKAVEYSVKYNCLAISTDGGAIIPALSTWEPIKTRRFGSNDEERINKLLGLMKDKQDRTIEWHEALALADKGKLLFSAQEKAMDGVISKQFNPENYREGIWLCSITDFPQFGGKNFFELTENEQAATEDSWDKLKEDFRKFVSKN